MEKRMATIETNQETDEWARIVERLDRMEARAQDHLTLEEGDKVVVVFLGEPWAYEAAWHDERKQWVPVHRSPQPVDPALRIRINVYVPAMGKLKWWEMDTGTFHSLYACRDKYGLSNWLFEIEAVHVSEEGASGVYEILPEEKLEAADLARIACRPLFQWAGEKPKLKPKSTSKKKGGSDGGTQGFDEKDEYSDW